MTLGSLADSLIGDSIDDVLRFGATSVRIDDVEEVHRFRVAMRRLRADLRTFRSCFDEATLDPVRAELRWLGQIAGAVRDMDVLAHRFESRVHTLSSDDRSGLSHLLVSVAAQRLRAQRNLRDALASPRNAALRGALVALRGPDALAPRTEKVAKRRARPKRAGTKLVSATWKSLAHAVRALSAAPSDASSLAPTDEELHRIRIRTKQCRYACEALSSVAGADARRLAHALERVQTLLGDHQDAVSAESWLRSSSPDRGSACFVAGELVMIERFERARCRDAWHHTWHRASRPRLRAWL